MNIYGGIFPLEEVSDFIFSRSFGGGGGGGVPPSVYSTTTTGGSPLGLGLSSRGGASVATAKIASRGELAERFWFIVDMAVNFLLHVWDEGKPEVSTEQIEDLASSILSLMIMELQIKFESPKRKALFSHELKLKRSFFVLANRCLTLDRPLEKRLRVLRMVNNHFRDPEGVKFLFDGIDEWTGDEFMGGVASLAAGGAGESGGCMDAAIKTASMDLDDVIGCKQFYEFLKSCGLATKKSVNSPHKGLRLKGSRASSLDERTSTSSMSSSPDLSTGCKDFIATCETFATKVCF